MRSTRTTNLLAAALLALLLAGCAAQNRLKDLQTRSVRASLTLPEKQDYVPDIPLSEETRKDTFTVMDGEKEIIIMGAVKDENGEMVAHDVLKEAVITARFRNIAERHGKIDLQFQVRVPAELQDSRWQLRFHPDMFVMEDSIRLETILITGKEYRAAQLKGYQQYERFLSRIISDSTRFINMWQFELFIKRFIPALYSFKTDSTEVSDEQFASAYGVTEQEAVEHYTNKIARGMNRRRMARKGKMYARYVKVPIEKRGFRLDTVLQDVDGDFVYNYTETIATRPKLRKVIVKLSGEIYEEDRMVYDIPGSEPLTFYISSLSTFTDNRERYLTKVIERRAEANTACYIDFDLGRAEVDEDLSNNREEIRRIKGNLASLMENREFDLDSIVVTASASPEGRESFNRKLSERRSEGISRFFGAWMKHQADSIAAEEGFLMDEEGRMSAASRREPVPFLSRSDGENWEMLDHLVGTDTVLTPAQKERYAALSGEGDHDVREGKMRREDSYQYFREHLYPRLRTVKFDFHLHRKGMVKDTVHTTILDTAYMEGVQALKDRDYERAVTLLRPYGDYNAALAFMSLDYNASAWAIVSTLEPSANVSYLKAILHSRRGEDREAVQCYLDACRENPTFVHRGNLDPEISVLIKKYGLNRQEEDEHSY